jgi:hypothetical protein
MSRTDRPTQQLFAIVRFDSESPTPEAGFTVKEIVRSLEVAETEVARLNRLNSSKGCRYFWQATRMVDAGAPSDPLSTVRSNEEL